MRLGFVCAVKHWEHNLSEPIGRLCLSLVAWESTVTGISVSSFVLLFCRTAGVPSVLDLDVPPSVSLSSSLFAVMTVKERMVGVRHVF